MQKKYYYFLTLLLFNSILNGQSLIIDEVISVVGDNKILYSDMERQYQQYIMQGAATTEATRCLSFNDLLITKLMVNQAELDSIIITDEQVERELDQNMKYYIDQFGSSEKLEEYFNKSIIEIKEENKEGIKERLMVQDIRRKIVQDIEVTPNEVHDAFDNIPKDSLPFIDAQVEVNQIIFYPASSEQAKLEVREKLLDLRKRILNGDNFATLAVLYSEDALAMKGGDDGFSSKAQFVDQEFAKAAFSLKEGQVSKIVESSFGFYLIQLMERSDDRVHTRHILLRPKISTEGKTKTREKLDSIITLIKIDTLTFEKAAQIYSEDPGSKTNGGQVVNPNTGDTKFVLSEFETKDYVVIKNLSVGDISEPYESTDENEKTIFKVVQLKSRSNPHVANLKDDYNLLKQMTIMKKQDAIVNNWIKEKIKTTYIRVNDKFKHCYNILAN